MQNQCGLALESAIIMWRCSFESKTQGSHLSKTKHQPKRIVGGDADQRKKIQYLSHQVQAHSSQRNGV